MRRKGFRKFLRITAVAVNAVFIWTAGSPFQRTAFAGTVLDLPVPGQMVGLSPAYAPVLMKGIRVFPDEPFRFEFIMDRGEQALSTQQFKEECSRLIKYFLAALTVPESDQWVNLSPYEKNRIIPDEFGLTDMGRDLLAQDYILKQITASLMYPEGDLGRRFWQKVYESAYAKFKTTQIPVNTFNKVWIMPDGAVVYEGTDTAFVGENRLKVMLDDDYLARDSPLGTHDSDIMKEGQNGGSLRNTLDASRDTISKNILKEIIVPKLEKEVNSGKNFAALRQVYYSMILATWFKRNLKESILNRDYAEQKKIGGIEVPDHEIKEKIYRQYLEAFKKGVYNYIKEDYDPAAGRMIPRKYFSGGFASAPFGQEMKIQQRPLSLKDAEALAASPVVVEAVLKNTGIRDAVLPAGQAASPMTEEAGTAFGEMVRQALSADLRRPESLEGIRGQFAAFRAKNFELLIPDKGPAVLDLGPEMRALEFETEHLKQGKRYGIYPFIFEDGRIEVHLFNDPILDDQNHRLNLNNEGDVVIFRITMDQDRQDGGFGDERFHASFVEIRSEPKYWRKTGSVHETYSTRILNRRNSIIKWAYQQSGLQKPKDVGNFLYSDARKFNLRRKRISISPILNDVRKDPRLKDHPNLISSQQKSLTSKSASSPVAAAEKEKQIIIGDLVANPEELEKFNRREGPVAYKVLVQVGRKKILVNFKVYGRIRKDNSIEAEINTITVEPDFTKSLSPDLRQSQYVQEILRKIFFRPAFAGFHVVGHAEENSYGSGEYLLQDALRDMSEEIHPEFLEMEEFPDGAGNFVTLYQNIVRLVPQNSPASRNPVNEERRESLAQLRGFLEDANFHFVVPNTEEPEIVLSEASSPLGEAREAVSDQDPLGGIDMDPAALRMETRRKGLSGPGARRGISSVDFSQPIHGLTPVIINITPVNLPLYLGFSEDGKILGQIAKN